jgi:hypothetical protein
VPHRPLSPLRRPTGAPRRARGRLAPRVRGRAHPLSTSATARSPRPNRAATKRKNKRRLGCSPTSHLAKFLRGTTTAASVKTAIAEFATDLFVKYRFKLTTVKQYLSRAGRDIVEPLGYGIIWTPKTNRPLKAVTDEVEKTQLAWIRRAAPIDRAFLRDAVALVRSGGGGAHRLVHLRCLIVQWFFLARVSEVVATGRAAGGTALLRKDVVALDMSQGSYRPAQRAQGAMAAALRFAGSKTDKAMAGQRRIVGSTGDANLCAVSCIQAQLALPGCETDPLFPETSTLSLTAFVAAVASSSGRDPSLYSTHSARRGGATAYFQACGNETMLKYFGRWCNNSTEHLTYMQPSLESMVTAGSRMVAGQATSMGW